MSSGTAGGSRFTGFDATRLRSKRAEREQYRREVTPYERQRYLDAM